MNGIEVKNVTKYYGDVCALDHVNLRFEQNKIYGLLGRNGAGKTTLLNTITGRVFTDTGHVLINGEQAVENDKALQQVFMMSEINLYPERMKVSEAIKWSGAFYPKFEAETATKIAARFGLKLNKKIKSLSTGYATIFKLVIALSVNAPFILLDEPVLGLDANHRDLLYRILIERFTENPCTYVISTHLIEEAAGVIEEVVIIKEGKIIRNESRESILSNSYMVSGPAARVDDFIQNKNVLGTDTLGGLKTAYINGSCDKKLLPEGLEVSKMDLQKLFIQLTNSQEG